MADPESNFTTSSIPEVRNKAPKAPGILPKNAQTWVIVTIATVMILVIAFSNSGTTKAKPKTESGASTVASPPNQRQIDQYRAMVDEEARKLTMERQRLDQARVEAQNATGNAQTQPPAQMNPYQNAYQSQNPYQMASRGGLEQSPEEIQRLAFETDRKKREYNSLFSSNLALSYRKDQNPVTQGGSGATGEHPDPAFMLPQTVGKVAGGEPGNAPSSAASKDVPHADAGTADGQDAGKRKKVADDRALQQADGPKYRLFEGTELETVLTNRLDGSFSGPANVMVTTNVYSHDHQQLLIPQGSRVLGEVQRVNSLGQQRLAVMFHRLIMPDGFAVSLDQFRGLNQIGETGLRDQVNHHYLQVFGTSLAIGAIAGVSQAGANYGASTIALDLYRQGVSTSLSQSALRILDRYLNILPTVVIREGHRVKVYLSDDLMLPAYDRHRLPANL